MYSNDELAPEGDFSSTTMSGGGTAAKVAQITVVLLFSAWLIDYIDRLVITLALPAIGMAYGLNKAEQGLILTVFFITYAVFQIPGGLLADRIGTKQTMTLALCAWSVFTGLTGLAFSYISLLVIRAIFGISEGIFPAASMKAITERTRPRQRLTANGVMMCSNSFGSALAPLIAGPALAAVGWKNSFFLVAILGIIMAGLLWRFLPRALPAQEAAASLRQGPPVSVRAVLTSPAMWLIALIFCGYDIIGWGLSPGYRAT